LRSPNRVILKLLFLRLPAPGKPTRHAFFTVKFHFYHGTSTWKVVKKQ
jgi:hypothetical protein